MNKEGIARLASAKTGTTLAISEKITQEVLNAIIDSIAKGESVHIRGFGTFAIAKRAGRVGRNININETQNIPPKVVPVFYPSPAFKEKVNQSQGGQDAN